MYIINILAPVFLIIILGAVLQKTGFINPQLARQNNRLVYWIALPCLLFSKTANAETAGDAAMRVFSVLVVGCFGCIILAYLISRTLKLSGKVEGAFVQAAFRGNLAYIGLPVVSYALAQLPSSSVAALNTAQLQSLAVLSFAPLVPIYNVMAVLVLVLGNRRSQLNPGLALVRSVVTNPLLLACVVGLSWSIAKLPLPLWLNNACQGVGQMALPLALIGIGVSLATSTIVNRSDLGNVFRSEPQQITLPLLAAVIKVIAAPTLGVLVAHWLGLSAPESTIALLYLACPTAVVSYIMAEQLGGDEALTSKAIVWSTLLSSGVLAFVLFMFAG